MLLRIDHLTEYRYREPVSLTTHLLRLHPRCLPGLRVLGSELAITPSNASLRWNLDAEGNCLGSVFFPGKTDLLRIQSRLLLEQRPVNPFDFLLEGRALHLPVLYDGTERPFLEPFLRPRDTDSRRELEGFLAPFRCGVSAGDSTLDFLTSLNRAIPSLFRYLPRRESGVRSAEETIQRGEGTCRDFAHLLAECLRVAGLATRYVAGYLCSPPSSPGENHTHGWCEVYLPGAGWRGFDPTNGVLAGSHHLAVATSVAAGDIPPVEGSFCGAEDLLLSHEVVIEAREVPAGGEEAA